MSIRYINRNKYSPHEIKFVGYIKLAMIQRIDINCKDKSVKLYFHGYDDRLQLENDNLDYEYEGENQYAKLVGYFNEL
jgi:hypothetical protein